MKRQSWSSAMVPPEFRASPPPLSRRSVISLGQEIARECNSLSHAELEELYHCLHSCDGGLVSCSRVRCFERPLHGKQGAQRVVLVEADLRGTQPSVKCQGAYASSLVLHVINECKSLFVIARTDAFHDLLDTADELTVKALRHGNRSSLRRDTLFYDVPNTARGMREVSGSPPQRSSHSTPAGRLHPAPLTRFARCAVQE